MSNLENSPITHPVAIPSCRQMLRAATHDAHVRLNHHRLLVGLVRPGYSLATYIKVLVAYSHFYRALEAAIEGFMAGAALDFDYAVRRKTPWLAADLRALGVDADAPAWLPPQPLAPIEIVSVAQLVGALYTIEGATLGGQVITRHIGANLGLTAAAGGRFFDGYGTDTDACWAQFEACMEALCGGADWRAQAARAACATFAAMEGVLDDYAA